MLQGFGLDICNIFVDFHRVVQKELIPYHNMTGKNYYITPIVYNSLLMNFKSVVGSKKQNLIEMQ